MITFSIDKGFEDGEGNNSTFDIKENNLNPKKNLCVNKRLELCVKW